MLVRSCFLITLIKCLKGRKSLGSLCNVKRKSHWLSEWQGHLLSCCGQLKTKIYIRQMIQSFQQLWHCFETLIARPTWERWETLMWMRNLRQWSSTCQTGWTSEHPDSGGSRLSMEVEEFPDSGGRASSRPGGSKERPSTESLKAEFLWISISNFYLYWLL